VHLAFLDETGTDGHSPIVMFGAVVITPGAFGWVERLHSTAIQQVFPLEEIETQIQGISRIRVISRVGRI